MERPDARAGPAADEGRCFLSLYVIGTAPASARAIASIRKLCEQHLAGRYELRIIDLKVDPAAAQEGQVIAAPTLVKTLPLPVRRFIGDMSLPDRVISRLELRNAAGVG